MMFTGIVQGTAQVSEIRSGDQACRLRLRFPEGATAGLVRGASVSIAGVCLTAVEIHDHTVDFDVIDETLRRTRLHAILPTERINFERAARFGDEIGGHAISGHVWGVGEIVERHDLPENRALVVRAPEAILRYVFEKGYIGIDGVSLTVGEVDRTAGTFSLHLIPESLEVTTLGEASVGTPLNIEVDAMTQAVVDTVERVLDERIPGR